MDLCLINVDNMLIEMWVLPFSIYPGRSVCQDCPPGFYCPLNTTNPTGEPCIKGHYCPQGTGYAAQYPCPEGTYNPDVGSTNSSACLLCLPGQYCHGNGLEMPSGNCSDGWFCTGGASSPKPMSSGKYIPPIPYTQSK